MPFLLQLIVIGVVALIVISLIRDRNRGKSDSGRRKETVIDGSAREIEAPASRAAAHLREFESARSELKGRYPAIFAMLGGYLNNHTIAEVGGVEAAAKEMIADWTPRREEVLRELTRLLAENETEEEARAIVAAACDAEFGGEGYRAWLVWLMGRFSVKA